MMTRIRLFISSLLLLLLVACGGGGGNAGSSPFVPDTPGTGTGGSTPAAESLVLTLSAGSISTSGSESVTATAIAVDVNRNTLAGVPVTISVNNNGIVTTNSKTTGTDGSLTATVGAGDDRTARIITVTATSGSLTRTADLRVQATGASSTDPSDLLLVLNSRTIANTGATTVTATVTALDAKRNVLPGVAASITVDNDGTVAPSGTSTGANGTVTGQIGIGANRTNRTMTITAAAGTLVRTITLQVVDAPTTTNPVAEDISLALSAGTLQNSGSTTVLATVTAVDRNRNALAGIPVTISVDSSAVASVSGNVTNAQGFVTANVGIGADRSNRVITVTASSGNLTRSASFSVVGATLTASFSPLVNTSTTNNEVEFRLVDSNSIPMPGQTVSITAPGLASGSGTTDANGKFLYSYAAPASPTTLIFVATAAGDTERFNVAVQNPGGGSVPPASASPTSASVTPSPSVISVNSPGSTSNQVELRALFLAANNQPVPNIRVRFDLDGNANGTDGTVSWLGGNYAYSDAAGVARGTFTPGVRSSPTNGVTIRACYDLGDFPITTCPNAVTKTLTVASEALSVNIRTNELIKEGPAKLTYIKEFVVMVVDAAGQAKPDVLITPSVDLPTYYKGFYRFLSARWRQTLTSAACQNEDINRNGVRESGEDINDNLELDPRKADVAIKMVSSAKTDANGLAIVQIEYGRNLASWVDFVITVTAAGVSGTESRATYSGLLPGLGNLPYPSTAVTDENISPAFVVSPYGSASVCTNPN